LTHHRPLPSDLIRRTNALPQARRAVTDLLGAKSDWGRPPLVRKLETYPLADYLYDRSRASDDLKKAELGWLWYIHRQPEDVQEAVRKVSRLFGKKPDIFAPIYA